MPKIILSFVGSQDPYSNTTQQPGSIVSLISHFQASCQPIQAVLLLYTKGTCQNAMDTQDWLLSEVALAEDAIELIAVGEALSDDPVDSLLAVQAARQAIERARLLQPADGLTFNASSGTPAMKTAWSILQAAGYASKSQVWQVRNPHELRLGQERVFQSNVDFLKQEFDLKIAKQQIQDHNYRSALMTLEANALLTDEVKALLQYGHYRMARDFDRAFSSLSAVRDRVDQGWIQEISQLRQKQKLSQLQEAYFGALIRLRNFKYADFLIDLFGLQESLIRFLVQHYAGLELSGERQQQAAGWAQIRQVDQGRLYRHLERYRLPKGDLLRLDESIGRYVMLAILDYLPQLTEVMPLVKYLNGYCDIRNRSVHEFAGVSEIEDEAKLVSTLKSLMKRTASLPETNPFDRLNQQICELLDQVLHVV